MPNPHLVWGVQKAPGIVFAGHFPCGELDVFFVVTFPSRELGRA